MKGIKIGPPAPVAQVDRAPASGAGCERSSRSRGAFYNRLLENVVFQIAT